MWNLWSRLKLTCWSSPLNLKKRSSLMVLILIWINRDSALAESGDALEARLTVFTGVNNVVELRINPNFDHCLSNKLRIGIAMMVYPTLTVSTYCVSTACT